MACPSLHCRLRRWFQGPAGQLVTHAEREALAEILPGLFGYHIVQIGDHTQGDLLESSLICHRVVFAVSADPPLRIPVGYCEAEHLPLQTDCVDVAVLPHLLEFSPDPHQVLREVDRILVGEGHVVLLGFNPISLWGIWRLLWGWRGLPPWSGEFHSAPKIKDWLRLLGFEVVREGTHCFHPPWSNCLPRDPTLRTRFAALSAARLGAIYLIVARKHLVRLTPLPQPWKARRRLAAGEAAEPGIVQSSVQSSNHGCGDKGDQG